MGAETSGVQPSDRDAGKSQKGKGTEDQGNPAKLPAQPGPSGPSAKPAAGRETPGQSCRSLAKKKKRRQECLSDTTTVNAATAPLTTVNEGQTPTTTVGCGVQSHDGVLNSALEAAASVNQPPESLVLPMLEVCIRSGVMHPAAVRRYSLTCGMTRKKVCRFRRKPALNQVDGATELVVSKVVDGVQYTVLIDPGSQVFALAPSSFFEKKMLTPAARPLQITVADGSRIAGGTHGATVSIALPVEHDGRMIEILFEDVFVYKADVVEHVILGYPFCKSYGLTIDPVRDCLMDISPSVSVFQMSHEASELRAPLGEPQQDSAISGDSQAGITLAMCRHCSELYSWSGEVGRCCQKHLVPTAPDRVEQISQCCATEVLRPVLSSFALLTLPHTHLVPAITAATVASVTAACISCFPSTGRPHQHERQPLSLDRQDTGDPETRTSCKHFRKFCMCAIDCFCVRQCMSEGLRPPAGLVLNDGSEPPQCPCTIDVGSDSNSEAYGTDELHSDVEDVRDAQSVHTAPPPDSFAGDFGLCRDYRGPGKVSGGGGTQTHPPAPVLCRHCKCEVDEVCAMCLPGDIPRDDLADDEQEGDPLKMAQIGSTPVASRRVRAQYSKFFRKMALQTPGKCRQAVRRKIRRSTKFLYSQGNHILLSSVRDMILKWAGLKGDQFVDVFASKQAHLFPEYWDKGENGLSRNWGLSDSKGRPMQKFLWLHPPHHLLQDTVTKIVLDQGRGILLVPVRKQCAWFWTLGEVALDWWDLNPSVPLYRNTDGLILQQSPHWTTRVVLFDAQGMDLRQPPEGKEWGCTDESAAAETDGCHQMCSGCCVCHSSHRALSPPSSMREARLRVLRQNTAAHDLLSERSLRAVVEGDRSDPRCVSYRQMLEKEFSTVFEFAKNILTDVDHSKRGEAGIARIKLKQGAVPQRVGPYRTVGVRDAAFRESISKFFERGMLEKLFSSWAARAFCVPKPGGKWRLVIDYRHLNSQIADEAFPLPVIEDLLWSSPETPFGPSSIWKMGFTKWFWSLNPGPSRRL